MIPLLRYSTAGSILAIFLAASSIAASCQSTAPEPQVLSLSECLQIALEKNRTRPASRLAVAVAEAEHRQALAAYWPQINVQGGVNRLSDAPNFLYPASTMYIPAQSVAIPGGSAMVTIPANALGPGLPPVAVQMPVSFPGQTVNTSAQIFPIPTQNVKLMDPTTESIKGNFQWLLLDGGMRRGYREQSTAAVEIARTEERRTDLEVTASVVRLYYGAVLARQLHQLGQDTLDRMEATLELTRSLYQDGTGTVNKTDYLDTKVMTETVRSMVAPLEANEASAEAALAYTMGLSWSSTVIPRDTSIPYRPYGGSLDDSVATAYQFNPDWSEIDSGLKALEGQRRTAASGYFPTVGLKGELHRMWNDYDGGLSTPQNRAGWSVDLGVNVPIFDGFLTQQKVAEAKAKIGQLEQQKFLLAEGIGTQLRSLYIAMDASEKVVLASGSAADSARDDTDLTLRAYQSGLIATEKVIRAQLQQALVTAEHDKAVYDHRVLQTQIDLAVGERVQTERNGDH